MSDRRSAHSIEFIRLNGHAVRVTSWRPGTEPGTFDLVTITRGSRDAELFEELLSQAHLDLRLGDDEAMTVVPSEVERRTFGEGQSGITRFSVVLSVSDETVQPAPTPEPSIEDRVAALEAEVERLRDFIHDLAAGQGR